MTLAGCINPLVGLVHLLYAKWSNIISAWIWGHCSIKPNIKEKWSIISDLFGESNLTYLIKKITAKIFKCSLVSKLITFKDSFSIILLNSSSLLLTRSIKRSINKSSITSSPDFAYVICAFTNEYCISGSWKTTGLIISCFSSLWIKLLISISALATATDSASAFNL